MTTATKEAKTVLVRISESNLDLSDHAEDIRGFKVFDQNNDQIGKVDNLLVDQESNKVRFLEVSSGGFLGIGEKTFMVPVDAIERVGDNEVHIGQTAQHVVDAPAYNPDTVVHDDVVNHGYWNDTYKHWGYDPFWTAGYRYPSYPAYGL